MDKRVWCFASFFALTLGAGCKEGPPAHLADLPEEWLRRIETAKLVVGMPSYADVLKEARNGRANSRALVTHVKVTLGDRNGSTGPDADRDGISDAAERAIKTNPNNADTDGDGIPDPFEIFAYRTNALVADSDGDGKPDGMEVDMDAADPQKDTDGDFVPDVAESAAYGSDPSKADTDGDGYGDWLETAWGTSPAQRDADGDGDGMPDTVELAHGTNAGDPGSRPADGDGDRIPDEDEADWLVLRDAPSRPLWKLVTAWLSPSAHAFVARSHNYCKSAYETDCPRSTLGP